MAEPVSSPKDRRPMTDAEARYAERLAADLDQVLGAGVVLDDLRISGDGPVEITVTCVVDGRVETTAVRGETLLEATREVVRTVAEIRLRLAFWQMAGPS